MKHILLQKIDKNPLYKNIFKIACDLADHKQSSFENSSYLFPFLKINLFTIGIQNYHKVNILSTENEQEEFDYFTKLEI